MTENNTITTKNYNIKTSHNKDAAPLGREYHMQAAWIRSKAAGFVL
jgi:hypothetical protein